MSDTAGLAVQELTLDSGVFYRRWNVESPRAVALMVHGLGEHSGRYQHVAEALAARSIASFAPDHPGHGLTPGHRCFINKFAEFYPALDTLREQIEADYPGVPCFIIGHSMGGLIAGNYLLENQSRFAGAAFSGAAFEVPVPPSGIAIFINRILASIVPKLGALQLDASEVSRDAEVVRRYQEDPLVHSGKITARLLVELFAAMDNLEKRRSDIALPVLVMHGEGDVMAAVSGSQHFFDSVGSLDKTLRLYPGLYHEIFNEPEQAQVLGELVDWLDAHIQTE
ncbi:alpha/beta hydrolase [Congregibacter variabilis]|uniref:Alpha/beta hydrolase n=1 Tax=Congregibacter variabilis TaxID=3081200 RepID=A0ABZ0I0E6_9GAMM|nr:alpha/beta hydrolase [Congregibacter sp. IMCC43200]